MRYTCTHTVSVKTIFVFSQAGTCYLRHASCNGGNRQGVKVTGWQPGGHFPFLQNFAAFPLILFSASTFTVYLSPAPPHSSPPSGRSLSGPRVSVRSLWPSSPPALRLAPRPPQGAQLRGSQTARPVAARGSGACALRRRRPPPPLPAAELCQVCEEPARASAGHGEPPPSPPPPRAQIFPELGSVLFPQRGRAWVLRRKGWRTP